MSGVDRQKLIVRQLFPFQESDWSLDQEIGAKYCGKSVDGNG
jgi:hypothetical protein